MRLTQEQQPQTTTDYLEGAEQALFDAKEAMKSAVYYYSYDPSAGAAVTSLSPHELVRAQAAAAIAQVEATLALNETMKSIAKQLERSYWVLDHIADNLRR
jgi:hypothetical protein